MSTKKEIEFNGIYWWGDSEVISILEKEIGEVLGETRVGTIEIVGTDFNDGKENRHVTIKVDLGVNKIIIEKNFSP